MIDFFTTQFGFGIVLMFVVIAVMLTAVAYCIYYERKIAAWTQDRYGPNRVGPLGLFQPLADGGKFILKEEFIPSNVDKPLYVLAPALIFVIALIAFAVVPWAGQLDCSTIPGLGGQGWSPGEKMVNVQVASVDIGLLYILGILSLGVYGIVLGGWASNNKYSFYGAMRACAQMLSYEIPMGLCILIVVLTLGTLRLENIADAQTGTWLGWLVCHHPLAFAILFVTALAEANRAPFDLAECEQELVGGYHTEYGAMKFALFFLAEYASMLTSCAFISVLFLGGTHLPFASWAQPEAVGFWATIGKMLVLCGKIAVLMFLFMLIRWTLPRFRFDQLMRFAWTKLVPMLLVLVVWVIILVYFNLHRNWFLTFGGNAAIAIGAWIFTERTPVQITGRQTNLPPARPCGPEVTTA